MALATERDRARRQIDAGDRLDRKVLVELRNGPASPTADIEDLAIGPQRTVADHLEHQTHRGHIDEMVGYADRRVLWASVAHVSEIQEHRGWPDLGRVELICDRVVELLHVTLPVVADGGDWNGELMGADRCRSGRSARLR